MTRLRKATMALPALLVVAGLAVPAIVGGGGTRPPEPAGAAAATYAGRTESEWRGMAMAALGAGEYARAIKYLKTAEKARPGLQHAAELATARAARRRSLDVASNRERMMGGEPDEVVLDDRGAVLSAHHTTVALPGESLWSIAVDLVAAWDNVLPEEVPDSDPSVYAAWDELTDVNGLRELEVGDLVALPLSDADERYTINPDGTIAATKPAGTAYTDFARATVEWFIARQLADSGAEYPNSNKKTADEIAWANYMKDASSLAGDDGVDFAGLLTDAGERSVRLPNPGSYFE